MNYKSFNLGDWIGHINGVIEDESELDGDEMRDLVEFLTILNQKLRWIFVSERLPEDYQRVLVTIVNYGGNRIVRVAEYLKGVFRVRETNERWEVGEKGLLAWMPLPEPYKSESIELLIKIPEEDYKSGNVMASAIRNGTILPKGHGRLIDADAFIETMKDASDVQI